MTVDEFVFMPEGAIQTALPMLSLGGALVLLSSMATHASAGYRLARSRPVKTIQYGDAISRVKKLTAHTTSPKTALEILAGSDVKNAPASVIPSDPLDPRSQRRAFGTLQHAVKFGWWNPGAIDPKNQETLEQLNLLHASMLRSYKLASIPQHHDFDAVQVLPEMMDSSTAKTELDNEASFDEPRVVFDPHVIEKLQNTVRPLPDVKSIVECKIVLGIDPAHAGRTSKAVIWSGLFSPSGVCWVCQKSKFSIAS
jgi:hypothetical protein